MPECPLGYIPLRLHQGDRIPIETFSVGEELYFRCKPEVFENPYKGISITELSHNRLGPDDIILCEPADVLFNIKEDEEEERYEGMDICTLRIISLDEINQFNKTCTETKNQVTYYCRMKLIHEPDRCMYPHAVFRVWLGDEIITYNNYKATIQKLPAIKAFLKNELASMIIQRVVEG